MWQRSIITPVSTILLQDNSLKPADDAGFFFAPFSLFQAAENDKRNRSEPLYALSYPDRITFFSGKLLSSSTHLCYAVLDKDVLLLFLSKVSKSSILVHLHLWYVCEIETGEHPQHVLRGSELAKTHFPSSKFLSPIHHLPSIKDNIPAYILLI